MKGYKLRKPRTVFVVLALLMTVGLASFIDFLATDYALARRDLARATASSFVAVLHRSGR